MISGLSAAEVLSGGLRNLPRNDFARVLTEPSTTTETVLLSSNMLSVSPCPSDGAESFAAIAAGALLGLPTEPARMSHKQVEQHRRLKAKQYFDELRCLIPNGTDPKCDRNRVLQITIEHIKNIKSGRMGVHQPIQGQHEQSNTDPANRSSGDHAMMFEMDSDFKDDKRADDLRDDKKLSHNEVEQRRRLQAKQHYDELRSLLPNSSKYDKNAVLHHSILLIQKLSGVSDEVLATRMHEYSLVDPEADAEEDVGSGSGTGGGGGAVRRRPSPASSAAASLSASPADVVQGMHVFGSQPLSSPPAAASREASLNRRSRKRSVKREEDVSTFAALLAAPAPATAGSSSGWARALSAPDHAGRRDESGAEVSDGAETDESGVEKKRSRRGKDEAALDGLSRIRLSSSAPASSLVYSSTKAGVLAGSGALSLLSDCAAQASTAPTPAASVTASPQLCPTMSAAWAALCLDPALSARLAAPYSASNAEDT